MERNKPWRIVAKNRAPATMAHFRKGLYPKKYSRGMEGNMKYRQKVLAGLLAAVLAVGSSAPMAAKADGKDEDGIYRWESGEDYETGINIEDAQVKEVTVKYSEKATTRKMQSVEMTGSNGTITAQLKVGADGVLCLHYTKNAGKSFTKLNIGKIAREKLSLSADTEITIYDMEFFGNQFTLTGYYIDKDENVHFFVLASSNMKTFVKRDMPVIENSGNRAPHLAKIGKQYIWYAAQEFWSDDPEAVADYKFIYYAGNTIASLKKKTVNVKNPLTLKDMDGIYIWSNVQDSGMVLYYEGCVGENWPDAKILTTTDMKKWSKPVEVYGNPFGEKAYSAAWSVQADMVVVQNFVSPTQEQFEKNDKTDFIIISLQGYDKTGKEAGFSAVTEKVSMLDMSISHLYITEKGNKVEYVTFLDDNTPSDNVFGTSLAFRVEKDGTVTAKRVPFMYDDGNAYFTSDNILRWESRDKEKGIYFGMDHYGNVYMTNDGFMSFVTFKAPDNGEGVLDFNVVGNYLIFDFAEKTCKVRLSTLYKNFE